MADPVMMVIIINGVRSTDTYLGYHEAKDHQIVHRRMHFDFE